MNMIHYEPLGALRTLRDDVNRLLTGALDGEDGSSVVTSRWAPAVDIKEEDERFVIHADIPGVDPKDIEITLDNGMLTIRGERRLEAKQEGDHGYRRVERLHGTFYRRFSLPDTADPEKVQAKGSHGVLEVVIPKQAAVQPKRIRVSS
jgi:HSP20 family protein